MTKPVPFDDALKATKYGKFNIAMVIICGACLYTVNADAYSIGYILPVAECDLNLSTFDKGILTSASFLGMIFSSHFWGFISDTKGRKLVIISTLICSFLCTFINSFLTNFWAFTILRFLSGAFMVGASANTYAYLGEFHVDKYRAISITCASIFIAIAIIALPGIAWIVLSGEKSINIFNLMEYKSWRLFLVLNSLPGFIIAFLLLLFPESPKFVFAQGDNEKTLVILKKMYSFNTGKSPNDYPVTSLMSIDPIEINNDSSNYKILRIMWLQTTTMFRKPHLLNTFSTCFLQFGLFAVSSGLLFWYPEIVNQLAETERKNQNRSITVCEAIASTYMINDQQHNTNSCTNDIDSSVFQQNLIIGGAYGIGFIVISLLLNYVGKRSVLVFCMISSGLSGVALYWISNRLIINFLFVGLLVLSGIAVGVVNSAVVDIFPTFLRGIAVSISLMFGRLGSVLASPIIGILMEYNCDATFGILSGILFACAGISLLIPNKPIIEGKQEVI